MWRVCANNAGLVMGFDIYNEIFIEIVKKKSLKSKKKQLTKSCNDIVNTKHWSLLTWIIT